MYCSLFKTTVLAILAMIHVVQGGIYGQYEVEGYHPGLSTYGAAENEIVVPAAHPAPAAAYGGEEAYDYYVSYNMN